MTEPRHLDFSFVIPSQPRMSELELWKARIAGEDLVGTEASPGVRASRTTSVAKDDETRQPTMRRVKTSITNATYTKPRQVATSVKSDTHS